MKPAPPNPRRQPRSGRSRPEPGAPSRSLPDHPRPVAMVMEATAPLSDRVLDLAETVIVRVDRAHPADAVLRTALREARGLTRDESGAVSRAVFAYCRWRGWLDASAAISLQLREAMRLAREFRRHPERFGEDDLRRRACPDWIGQEMEVTVEWLRTLQSEPPLWLRARRGEGHRLAARLGDCRAAGEGPWSDALRYSGRVDLFRTPEFRDGRFEIQDLHSQVVGWLCQPQPGETWWDACAGEGGKTLHLAELMGNRGSIWATDRAPWRLEQLKRRAARAGVFNYRMRHWEGGPSLPTRTQFDGVLVDAPCSNVGTWHRNPHARWTTRPEDVRELAAVQLRLLGWTVPALKPGGRLIYAVCTMTRAETVGVVEAFAAQCPDLEPMPLTAPLASAEPVPAGLWLHPGPASGNGMFVSAWRRRHCPLAKGSSPTL